MKMLKTRRGRRLGNAVDLLASMPNVGLDADFDLRKSNRVEENMEPILLFTVELAFEIKGRGCVLVPGPAETAVQTMRIGDAIRLLTPDGRAIDTQIRGIEMLSRHPRPQVITFPILLPKDVTKEQVPIGTRVMYLQS